MGNDKWNAALGAQWSSEEAEQTGVSIDPEYPNWRALPPPAPLQLNAMRELTSSHLHQQTLSNLPGTLAILS